MHLTGAGIGPAQGLPGPVQEGLLPSDVPLPHGHLQRCLPALVVLAELGVAVTCGMVATVLLPQQLQRRERFPQLLVDILHVGLGTTGPAVTAVFVRRRKEQCLELILVQLLGQRPGESGLPSALQVVGDGGVGKPATTGDLAVGEPDLMLEAQDFDGLAHGQPPSCHRHLLFSEGTMTGLSSAAMPFRHLLTTRFGRTAKGGNFQTETGGNFAPNSVVTLDRNGW